MTKDEFISFISDLGFTQNFSSEYSMETDEFEHKLEISIDKELIQLSLSETNQRMNLCKRFSNFSLKTFGDEGDFQLEIFLNFIVSSFEKNSDIISKIIIAMRK